MDRSAGSLPTDGSRFEPSTTCVRSGRRSSAVSTASIPSLSSPRTSVSPTSRNASECGYPGGETMVTASFIRILRPRSSAPGEGS